MRSCSWAVFVEKPAEQVAPVDPGRLIVADEGPSGGWIRWFQFEREGCANSDGACALLVRARPQLGSLRPLATHSEAVLGAIETCLPDALPLDPAARAARPR